MIKNMKRFNNVKNEGAVKDPHELLLSLVDMGSLDVEDALLACVKEMSDAECKRVLGSISLPACCDEVEEPEEDMEDVELDDVEPDDGDTDIEPVEPAELDDDIEDMDDEEIAEVEARIRKLERAMAMNQKSEEAEKEDEKEDEAEEMNERCCEARTRRLENLLRRRMLNRRFR